MSDQKQCPQCHQYKVMSHRKMATIMGVMALSIGIFLVWIPFIGIPLAAIGLLLIVGASVPFTGASKHFMCNNCRYKWKEE